MKIFKKDTKKETRSISLTIFLMRLLGMWHVSNKKDELLANTMIIMMWLSMLFSIFVQSQDLYNSRTDLMLITFVAPCAVLSVSEFSKLTVFIKNRDKVLNLNEFVDRNFWKLKYNDEETKLFNDCDRLCFGVISVYVVLLQGICWQYLLAPLLENSDVERKFPFPIHFDVLHETPFYEIIYVLQILGTMSVCLCTTTFASYMFAMNCFMATQFRILGLHLQSLGDFDDKIDRECDGLLQREAHARLKKCIKKHQIIIGYTGEMENLFCYVMLGQIFGSVTQICFCGLQILLTSSSMYSISSSVTLLRTILSLEYLIASVLQFLFYCYSSHELYAESEKVSTAVYYSKWYCLTDYRIHKDYSLLLQMIMHRAKKPCVLTVGKFYPLTLHTFTSVLSSSMSYFSIFRQTIERQASREMKD